RDRAILELFYASGLRLSELVDLDLEDTNLSSRVVRVRGKGGKERLVPFNRSAADAIRAMMSDWVRMEGTRQKAEGKNQGKRAEGKGKFDGRRGEGRQGRRRQALFLNLRGQRLSTRSVDRIVRRYVRQAAISGGISPH